MASVSGYLRRHPQIRAIRSAAADLNGVARGKRLPAASAAKLDTDGMRFPYSALNLDIWGNDIVDSPLVFDSGDRDGVLRPTGRGPVPMPWLQAETALVPIWMFHEDGRPFAGDPRHALAAVLGRWAARGLRPVTAMEFEFFLIDDSAEALRVPAAPRAGPRRAVTDTLSIRALDAFDAFFNDLATACDAMDLPADAISSEAGRGQFEINLRHQSDALRAADDAWLFKMAVKGVARAHGFAACFMAKPYEDASGNGLHTHFSALDEAGRNVFDDGGAAGTDLLRHAVAGCLGALRGSTLIFAPHPNSYERLQPEAHAPLHLCWAYENRTSAIRVPGGAPAARRIEHRVAGGDCNPYLSLAAILGAALNGLEDAAQPPAPITGNAYAQDLPELPQDMASAIDLFATDPGVARIFSADLIRNLVMTKRQEMTRSAAMTRAAQVELLLDTV